MPETMHLNESSFLDDVQRQSGVPVGACFQCHKCSTGCPVGPESDFCPAR